MDKFNPQDYLLGVLQKAVAKSKDFIVSHDEFGVLAILIVSGEYFTNVSDMEEFCRVPSSQLTVRKMSSSEIIDCCLGEEIGRNLDELMWMAGYYASKGRLMEGLNQDDVVNIKHWPNLTRLPNNFHSFQMAAMLTRHPTTIVFAHRVLKIPQEEINSFYTAAHCAGLAVTLNTPLEALPMEKKSCEGTLLSRIIGRIASL